MIKKPKLTFLLTTLAALGTIYYAFFTLDNEPIALEDLLQQYQYRQNHQLQLELEPAGERMFKFSYQSFDGSRVNGQISYPLQQADKYPVLVGMHAMGRSYPRWWVDQIKDRPTITRINKITEMAHQQGYAVIAIDARHHGSRKDPERKLSG